MISISIKVFFKKFEKLPSSRCSMHGYYYNHRCFCFSQYQGIICDKKNVHGWYEFSQRCDILLYRLDNLLNINPDHYFLDDDEFPRLQGNSIGNFPPSYGQLPKSWIRMKDLEEKFSIFGNQVSAKSIVQGALGDCYFLAAMASLANIRDGEIIKDIFQTKDDNQFHVYVTRWVLNGKPQFVAVDQWIPGENKEPAFAKVFKGHAFWGIIIEKAWAKILSQYMRAESGVASDVWQGITGAISNRLDIQLYTVDEIFDIIQMQTQKQYPVTAGTYNQQQYNYKYQKPAKLKMVEGHMYSVLNAYIIKDDRGYKQKLIKLFNPWNREVWIDNPWGGNGRRWSQNLRKQLEIDPNDGIFHLTPEDFHDQFLELQYASIHQGYEIAWYDQPFTNFQEEFQIDFYYIDKKQNHIYPYVQLPIEKLYELRNCQQPIYYLQNSFIYIDPRNYIKLGNYENPYAKIRKALNGLYTIKFILQKRYQYIKQITFSVYAPKGTIQFINNGQYIQKNVEKPCPNRCNGKGRCNTFNGKCMCYFGYAGPDCSQIHKIPCPNDCNGNGICDKLFGKCICQRGFFKDNCVPCFDLDKECREFTNKQYCRSDSKYFEFMQENCQKSCGEKGYYEFQQCHIPRKPYDSDSTIY